MMVSVIIPTYNEADVIGGCIESLSKQTYKDLEVVVVDDGSTDDTERIVSNYQLPITNYQLLRQRHAGAGAARNLGARHTSSDILVFVDADMTFEPDFVEKLVAPIIKGKAKGTFSKEEYVANGENSWARMWNLNRGLPADRMHPSEYPDKQKVFRAILKSEFQKVGGFDEKAGYTDDWTLSEKLGYEAVAAPGAKFYHKNPESLVEVFKQTQWMGKRRYKLGLFGVIFALIRVSLPISVVLGVIKGVLYKKPEFLIFKIVHDLGIFIGITEFSLIGKHVK